MWIQLLSIKYLDQDGARRTFHPGDWVDVGKQLALQWIAAGEARLMNLEKIDIADGAGVVLGGNAERGRKFLDRFRLKLAIGEGEPEARFPKTCYWQTSLPLRVDLLPVGFQFLDTWEVAIPLASYRSLVEMTQFIDDVRYVESVIHDERVPTYDPRLLFMRDCENARALLDVWREEREKVQKADLALLVAIYRVKPLILALPTTWIGGK